MDDNKYRIWPLVHDLARTQENCTDVEQAELVQVQVSEVLEQLQQRGFGGVVMNVSFNDYLRSEQAWQGFEEAVRKLRDAGLGLWLYDERGYPSGKAGGLTLEGHPEYEAKGLYQATFDLQPASEPLRFEVPGSVLAAKIVPQSKAALKLSGEQVVVEGLDAPGKLYVWFVARAYEGTHCVTNVSDRLPYVDLMDAEAIQRFISLTHQAYYEHLPEAFEEGWFEAIFTDEPSLMSAYLAPETPPYPITAWSRGLAEEYADRYGERLEDHFSELFEGETAQAGAIRRKFYSLVTNRLRRSYFQAIRDWCKAHNIKATGHLLYEEGLTQHVAFYGDALSCLLDFDVPGVDLLSSDPSGFLTSGGIPAEKLASSAAHLQGLNHTMTETSDYLQRLSKVEVDEQQIRATLGWQMALGINHFTSYYPWRQWDAALARRLNEYVARCCRHLREVEPAIQVAVLYPIRSAWTHFVPQARPLNDLSPQSEILLKVHSAFGRFSHHLLEYGVEYDYITEEVLQEAALEGTALGVGKQGYRVLILPEVTYLEERTLAKLAKFQAVGGLLLKVGTLPCFTGDGTEPARLVNDLPTTSLADLTAALDERQARPLITPEGPQQLVWCARKQGNRRVYFVQNHSASPFSGTLKVAGEGEIAIIEPATGERPKAYAFNLSQGWVEVALQLEPWNNILILVE